jgi:hypothetical protein
MEEEEPQTSVCPRLVQKKGGKCFKIGRTNLRVNKRCCKNVQEQTSAPLKCPDDVKLKFGFCYSKSSSFWLADKRCCKGLSEEDPETTRCPSKTLTQLTKGKCYKIGRTMLRVADRCCVGKRDTSTSSPRSSPRVQVGVVSN